MGMESIGDIIRVCNRARHFDGGVEFYHEKLVVEYYVYTIVSMPFFYKNRIKRTVLYFGHLNERGQ
jgi:hypothetical protein